MDDGSKGIRTPSSDEPEPQPQPVGEAVGGIVGTAAGAGLGALAGPLGVLMGAAAGALGGWWAGHTVSDVLENFSDVNYRRTHQDRTGRDDFDRVRDFYRFGHLAGSNPDYQGRSFQDIEPDLRRSWPRDAGSWEDARDYIEEGYKNRD
jgi:hypothetical protein